MNDVFQSLSEEDKSFIERFILQSGSLKDLATEYSISYPTIRLRLDRLIEKIKLLRREDIRDEFERELRVCFSEGRIDEQTFRRLLEAHAKINGKNN